ncbi:MAG TPA: hypothetical protein VG937_10445 [Polyangiaceae bacterium]|nr:hypothetical protein [Polyangiaceae bacterium]
MQVPSARKLRLALALLVVTGCAELWNFQDVTVDDTGITGGAAGSPGTGAAAGEGGAPPGHGGSGGSDGNAGGRSARGGTGAAAGDSAGSPGQAGEGGVGGNRGGSTGQGGTIGQGGSGGTSGGTVMSGGAAGTSGGSGAEGGESGAAGTGGTERCAESQAWSDELKRCRSCTLNCDEPGTAGLYPLTTKDGRCVCRTETGYFYEIGASIGAYPCDADGDGWVRDSARSYIETTDRALHDNARCTLRLITGVTLHNEGGETYPLYFTRTRNVSTDPAEAGGVLPLYESVRNDDAVQLAAAGVTVPNYGTRALSAAELNGFTKACVSVEADHNDNGVRDFEEWARLPSGQVEVPPQIVGRSNFLELYTRFSYFVELNRAGFSAESEDPEARTVTGRYEIRERSRQIPDNDGIGLVADVGDTSEYWRTCERRRDALYSPNRDPITNDFASLDGPDLDGTPWNGMRHHSQFKCVELVLPQERDAETLHKQSISALGTPEFPWTLNSCGLTDSTPPSPGTIANPSSPVVSCRTEVPDNVLLGTVAWAETGFKTYSHPPNKAQYARGCVDECGEAPEPECYECDPSPFGEKQVSFSRIASICSAGRCDGAGNCGECVPADTRCRGPYVQQRCNAGGDWEDELTCSFGCDPSESVRACACYLDAPEDAGLSCDAAKYAGRLDVGTQFEITGRIAKPDRSHWYRVDIPPGPRSAAGFSIQLDTARSGSTFRMAVSKGCSQGNYSCNLLNPGAGTPAEAQEITHWEFNDNCGADCDDSDRVDIVRDSEVPAVAYVHVRRTDDQVRCDDYVLSFRRP